MKIGDKIKSARLGKNYTQEEAAEKLLVSRQTIYNWENGKSLPDILSVLRMSDLYGLSLDELLKGDQDLMEKIEKDAKATQTMKKVFKFMVFAAIIGVAMLVLRLIFPGTPVLDFTNAALPWIFFGLMFLFYIRDFDREENEKADEKETSVR